MSKNDFDDFFEVDANGNIGQEKTELLEKPGSPKPPVANQPTTAPVASAKPVTPVAPKPPQPEPTTPKPSPPPSAAPSTTDNKMLSDFGDFDSLFEKAENEPTPKPAPMEDAGIDDLLSDFAVEKKGSGAPIPKPVMPSSNPVVPPLQKTLVTPKGLTKTSSTPGKSIPPNELSRPEEALEELFSEVSQADALPPEPSGEALESGLGIEFIKKKKKLIKNLSLGGGATLVAIGLIAVVMARFSEAGFFGWNFGQKPKDGYEVPSSRVLKQLKERFDATGALFQTDQFADYKKIETELTSILKIDPRNSPTDARLAETLLLMGDKTVTALARKNITNYISQSEKYHPEIIETLRAKSRAQLADGQYPQAESIARKALSVGSKDVETVNLMGEISLAKGDLDQAAQYFNQAISINSNWPRAQHFLGVTRLQQGNVDDAERIFRELINAQPPHVSSEVELWRLMFSQRGKAQEAKEGLKKLIETQASNLSFFDLGRAWKVTAEIAESQKDMTGAIAAVEKAVEIDRSSHTTAFYLGRLYLSEKQNEKAVNEFSRASSLSPQTAEYLIYEGNALREMGKLPESLVEVQKGLEKEPLNVEGLYQLGLTQRALSRTEEAITSFENVLKGDSRHLDSMLNLSELYLARDNFSMARNHLKTALLLAPKSVRARNNMGKLHLLNRKFDEALEELKLAEAEDAKQVDVLSNLGRAYLAKDQMDKAALYFEKALLIDPTLLDTQVAMGELQHRRKDYAKALETYRNVLKVRPKDYDTRDKVAEVLIDQQSFQEAITELQEASKWSPNYYPTRLNLGVAWRGLGSLDASSEQLQIALQLRPEAAEAHYQMEMTHIFRNDPINAEASMEKAVGFDLKYIDPLVSLGDFFDSRNLYGKAVVYYIRAEKIQPKNSEVLLKIADSFRKEENNKKAKEYYQKTIAANRASTEAYIGLSLLAEDAGDNKNAVAYLKKAQMLDPNDPKPYYYLGFLYKDLPGQKNAAVLSFKKYLKLDPASKEKTDIEDQIFQLTR